MTNPTAAIAAPDLPLECVRPGRKRYPIPSAGDQCNSRLGVTA